MAKSSKDLVQDSPRKGLGIPIKTKNPLSRNNTPPAKVCYKRALFNLF